MTAGRLHNKVAVVTGGTRGIGEALVRKFSAEGAHVAFSYLGSEARAEAICRSIDSIGGKAVAFQADARDANAVGRLMDRAGELGQAIDILVNNAHAPYENKLFEDAQWEDFQREIDLLLKGPFYAVKAALPYLKRATGGGVIINVGSSMTHKAIPRHSFYVAAKHALWGFTDALAVELGTHGIRVNMVTPGPLMTDHNLTVPAELLKQLEARTPLGRRMGTCEEAADAIVLMSLAEARFVTRTNLDVTGGL
jgi:3-oxoacyl-[acyl-carrier protein] reductase